MSTSSVTVLPTTSVTPDHLEEEIKFGSINSPFSAHPESTIYDQIDLDSDDENQIPDSDDLNFDLLLKLYNPMLNISPSVWKDGKFNPKVLATCSTTSAPANDISRQEKFLFNNFQLSSREQLESSDISIETEIPPRDFDAREEAINSSDDSDDEIKGVYSTPHQTDSVSSSVRNTEELGNSSLSSDAKITEEESMSVEGYLSIDELLDELLPPKPREHTNEVDFQKRSELIDMAKEFASELLQDSDLAEVLGFSKTCNFSEHGRSNDTPSHKADTSLKMSDTLSNVIPKKFNESISRKDSQTHLDFIQRKYNYNLSPKGSFQFRDTFELFDIFNDVSDNNDNSHPVQTLNEEGPFDILMDVEERKKCQDNYYNPPTQNTPKIELSELRRTFDTTSEFPETETITQLSEQIDSILDSLILRVRYPVSQQSANITELDVSDGTQCSANPMPQCSGGNDLRGSSMTHADIDDQKLSCSKFVDEIMKDITDQTQQPETITELSERTDSILDSLIHKMQLKQGEYMMDDDEESDSCIDDTYLENINNTPTVKATASKDQTLQLLLQQFKCRDDIVDSTLRSLSSCTDMDDTTT